MAPDDDLDLQDPFAENEPEALDDSNFAEAESEKKGFNRRYLLIGLVFVLLLCLVAILVYRVFTENGGDEVAINTPTPASALTEEPTIMATVEEQAPTPSPTRVIEEEETEPSAPEPTQEPTPTKPALTPAPPTPVSSPPPSTAGPGDLDISVGVVAGGPSENSLKNGDFEAGFDDQGVARDWTSFNNGAAIVSYSKEITGPLVKLSLIHI